MTGRTFDPRFPLRHRQPRADKLDARQLVIYHADPAFQEALKGRVKNADRFSAYISGATYYIVLEAPCLKCGSLKKRTRDRSCHGCHLRRSGANFERIKAGISPITARSLDGHLDALERKRAEKRGEHSERQFDDLTAKWFPTGRLSVTFPDGYEEPDVAKLQPHELTNAIEQFPALLKVMRWANWTLPG